MRLPARSATYDDARSHANAHGAATADATDAATATADDGTTANDGTNGAIISRGTAAATKRAAIGPAAALCRIWNGSTNGEELLTVRGGQTGSFKQYFTCCREQTVSDPHPKYFPNSSRIR